MYCGKLNFQVLRRSNHRQLSKLLEKKITIYGPPANVWAVKIAVWAVKIAIMK